MIKEIVGRIESSESFRSWKENNKSSFLSNAFVQDDEWQFSYYNPVSNKITTFFLKKNQVFFLDDQEVLESGKIVKELNLDNVKLDYKNVIDAAKKQVSDSALKTFLVVQTLDDVTVFNITLFTQTQQIFNIKIDASDGEILSSTTTKLSEFYKVLKKSDDK